ncbi:hypothetical protein SEA_PUPPER_135 [Gordonia phage Pupper]|uniref:Uncharacterized protein n=1 Tax=Gordonia phage Pupper TaxID=2571249 RepID=A0A4Y6EMI9_9CAUD|nr:hypothetical protein KHQ83_gp142 [Gordonia phage Pupper]QDF18621.1 hypothetical protein SEA_PUPPER_135 [Gordonia phage Pupper]
MSVAGALILGIILIVVGYFLPLQPLVWVGAILVIVGVILWILSATGRPINWGGRTRL